MSGPAAKINASRKGRMDWETPPWLFDELHKEFRFTVDAAAHPCNFKLPSFWSKRDDGLTQSWSGQRVFCNPPYGYQTGQWVKKAVDETAGGCPLVVLLVPCNTETFWFHDLGLEAADEVRMIRRRIHFLLGGERVRNGRPVFASCVLVLRSRRFRQLRRAWHLLRLIAGRERVALATTIHAPNPKRLCNRGHLVDQQLALEL